MAVTEPTTNSDPVNIYQTITALKIERLKFTSAQQAPNTSAGYRYDQAAFRAWGLQVGLETLAASPDTLGLYVTSMLVRGLKIATCARRVAAIARWHLDTGHPSPATDEIRSLLNGARRLRTEQVDRVLPLALEEMRAISVVLLEDDTPIGIRNWAIMLTGFEGALRNSMTAALRFPDDVEFSEKGAILQIRREKTDQLGKGRKIGLHHAKHPELCAVVALRKWIARRGNFPGPLFTRFDGTHQKERALLPERIGQIVQQNIRRIGLDSRLYGGHSLRAGFVTLAGEHGASELLIAATTGHKDLSTLRIYFRRRDAFAGNPLGAVDL